MLFKNSNLHTHTRFSDGAQYAEDYINSAIEKGFASIGFSDHVSTDISDEYCVVAEKAWAYKAEIAGLKEKYKNHIEVYCGIELEHCNTTFDVSGLDYIIGAVHFLFDEETGQYFEVDHKPEMLEAGIKAIGKGDARVFIEKYYKAVAECAENRKPGIIAHIDLVKKLNRDEIFFDENAHWYEKALKECIMRIKETGAVIEVNTGGIARGYRAQTYPDFATLMFMRENNVPVTISSDAHCVEHLDFYFEEAAYILRTAGYKSIVQLRNGKFQDIEI